MWERRAVAKAFAKEYRKASKKEKGAILDRFVEATDYQRRYAARLLRHQGRRLRMGGAVVVGGGRGLSSTSSSETDL